MNFCVTVLMSGYKLYRYFWFEDVSSARDFFNAVSFSSAVKEAKFQNHVYSTD